MNRSYIKDQQSLVSLCEKLSQADVLAIDTEFVRTRTLYPKLGLLQINDGENLALIDPITIDDLSPFWQLLTNKNITKVLHACSEDLEVFLTAGQCKPVNLIDSQVMMSFLGHGLSLGYAAMIQHYTGIELDKSESRTDWTKRPLTDKQIVYAQADVEHLFAVYPKILAEITEAGWLSAAKQETQLMIERKFTPIDATLLYQNVKMSWRLNSKQLNVLKFLTMWRFEKAKQKDLPIGFIAKDHTLMAIAQSNPSDVGQMSKLEGAEMLDIRHQGRAMLTVVKEANLVDVKSYPEKIVRLDEYPGYKQIFKQVKTFVVQVAQEHDLAVENLASKKQINQFLSWHFKLVSTNVKEGDDKPHSVDILKAWRFELFGEKLQKFANDNF